MGNHDAYGKEILVAAAGNAFHDRGPSVEVSYGAGHPARIDGSVGEMIAIEIESRTSKQVRGAVMDLLFHPWSKKLLVLLPVHMSDCDTCAAQCRYALGRFVKTEDFRVVVLKGTGDSPETARDVELITRALSDLGFSRASNLPIATVSAFHDPNPRRSMPNAHPRRMGDLRQERS